MVLISIQPFSPKTLFALAATIICLSTASCFASAAFFSVASTPYDRQMSRISSVLSSATMGGEGDQVPLALVNQWMGDLREIPYAYHLQWKTPSEVQSRQPADCKGKAIALYQRMQSKGAKNVSLVIGKRAPTSRMTHTWLLWETKSGSFVLDPTFDWMARRSEQITVGSYVPLYAYAHGKKYRASTQDLYARN